MRKFLPVFLIMCLLTGAAFAQSRTVSGKVTAKDGGEALPGVNILAIGTKTGSVTDVDGNFTLEVPEGVTKLSFSFVGFMSQEVTLSGNSTINVSLETDAISLEEVVIVAYGEKSKRSITGAISTITAEDIGGQINVSPLRAIQGVASGVNVLTSGGQPGENPSIRIRGIGSVNASAEPLIVVDGVVFSGNINAISGDQIESISVLKDASSSALYGSRAANGVLLITTKGGKFGAKSMNVNINARAGYSSPAVKNYELVGADQYMEYSWEALKNSRMYGNANNMSEGDAAQWATDNLIKEAGYNPYGTNATPVGTDGKSVGGVLWDTDWFDAMTRPRSTYNEVTFSADGGSENMSYFFSGNHLKQEGSIRESAFERLAGRLNLRAKLTDKLEFGTNNSFSRSTQDYPNQSGSSYTSTMQWVNSISSVFPIYARDEQGNLKKDANGNNIYDYGNTAGQSVNASRIFGGGNAVGTVYLSDVLNKRTQLFSSSYLKLELFQDLSFQSKFGYERYMLDQDNYTHYKYGNAASVGGRVERDRDVTETVTFTNSLDYSKAFGEHEFGVSLISEVFEFNQERLGAQGTGFLPGVKVLDASTVPESVSGFLNQERLVSYMARFDYEYGNKYFADISFRRDASTRFKSGNRWGNFFSIGASWILSEEDFIQNLSDKISLLKLRTSYGELGNNRILDDNGIAQYFPYFASFGTGWSNNSNTGVLKGGIVDENLKWEKTAKFNVGLDFGFFNNRLTGTVEYYNNESVDLIFNKPLALSLGSSSVTTNIGTVSNSGVEVMLNSVNYQTENIEWRSSFNIAFNKNELLKLPQEEIINGSKKLRVGKSVYDFFIQEYAGVDPATGDALWYMDSGTPREGADGVVMTDDEGKTIYDNYEKVTTNDYAQASRYYQGSSLPDATGGFSNYFRYKNFDLNVLFNYSVGGQIYDYDKAGLMNSVEQFGNQISTDISARWQKPGDITDVPKLYNTNNDYNSRSSRFLFDNDYVRLKALTLGYNLPAVVLNKVKIKSFRVYLQADNIWTWQSHKGLDPEQNFSGTTDSRSNMLQTISIGINAGL